MIGGLTRPVCELFGFFDFSFLESSIFRPDSILVLGSFFSFKPPYLDYDRALLRVLFAT